METFEEFYANPSSVHKKGVEVEKKIKEIRVRTSKLMGIKENEIIFTSGGTESNNMAIKGVCLRNKKQGNHIITTNIEHPSAYESVKYLEEKEGFEVTYLKPDKNGCISFNDVKDAIRENTILISIMHVNNETGAIQPVDKIGKYLSRYKRKIYFHVDAVQSFGKINFKPSKYNIDLMSISSHKIHGPKGVGILYMKDKTPIEPIMSGGGQEKGLRSGTENVPGIFGFGKAIELTLEDQDGKIEKMKSVKSHLKNRLESEIDNIRFNSSDDGVCHILNVSFMGTKGEVMLHSFEQHGLYVSTGSACSSKKKGSRVLTNMNLSNDQIEGAIRLSISEFTGVEDVDSAVEIIKKEVGGFRDLMKYKR